jgi:hypothetical protein
LIPHTKIIDFAKIISDDEILKWLRPINRLYVLSGNPGKEQVLGVHWGPRLAEGAQL